MNPCQTLLFGTAGVPKSSPGRDSVSGIEYALCIGLDAMELEYVRGTFPRETTARKIAGTARRTGIRLTAHGPYYINLNSEDPGKRSASRERIFRTAETGWLSGAESVTFHAGFHHGAPPGDVYETMRNGLSDVVARLHEADIRVDVRPELTGKQSQFGSLDEICRLSRDIDGVLPCIDWSHYHARRRALGLTVDFESVIEIIRANLGDDALSGMHMHVSGMSHTVKGERKHLDLDDSDFDWRRLVGVLRKNGVTGVMICESPSQDTDALKLKDEYHSRVEI